MIKANIRHFGWAYFVTALGLMASFVIGWHYTGTFAGASAFFTITGFLALLEISLSFDNAIVNANTLKNMTPIWQQRFLTWGILIAVFGMRIIFPLAVVAIAAHVGPIEAIWIAAHQPEEYARLMHDAHMPILAFGGTFLMMVALNFFVDSDKELHWIKGLENCMKCCAGFRGFAVGLVLLVVLIMAFSVGAEDRKLFLSSAILGLAVFIAVEFLGRFLDGKASAGKAISQGGLGAFLYLEMLDASFSFDGVIGAFAITQNLFLIAIGLGIGAMYVRSLTIMIVEKKTLTKFHYLEHGAFYSIFALSLIMFVQVLVDVPEILVGLIGVVLIGLALISSIISNKRNAL